MAVSMISLLSFCGCEAAGIGYREKAERPLPWNEIYDRLESSLGAMPEAEAAQRFDISLEQTTADIAARSLAETIGQTIILDPDIAAKTINLKVRQETAETLLQLFARQLAADVSRIGNAYIIGNLRPQDMGVLITRCGRLTREEAANLVAVAGSGEGRVLNLQDGLLIAADRTVAITRITDALDRVNANPASTWVCQVYLINQSDALDRNLAIGAELDASFLFRRASASAKAWESGRRRNTASGTAQLGLLSGTFSSWLAARSASGNINLVQSPLVLLNDGVTSTMHSGRNIPVPKRAISDQGTATITDYINYRDGLQMSLTVRDIGGEVGMLTIDLALSQVEGFNAAAPVTLENSLATTTQVQNGGVYLLGSLETQSKSQTRKGIVSVGSATKKDKGTLEVWARVYRISGSAPDCLPTTTLPDGLSLGDFL